ncbi:MAG: glycogen/starch synthase [Phycisphaerales bacterium]|nr:glycogen/starch synthase [Phycisphaerales bacterium]
MLFEVAWEVCNQVGGIYQVLKSKVPLMVERWADRYCLVGPYIESKANLEFEPTRPTGWIGRAIAQLKDQGLTVHHGRWLVPGRPRVLLVEHWLSGQRLAEVKYRLWADHGIETPGGDGLIDGVISFAEAMRRLFTAIADQKGAPGAENARLGRAGQRLIIGHFHEWMGGLAIPLLRRENAAIATVFTTHATLLGRYIASSEENFYDRLPWINEAEAAARYNVRPQHAIERACAHGAHVFTTVSAVTAEECASLLGRPVDLVLPNGLNVAHYNATHDQQRFHAQFKNEINRFVAGHFFPSYPFDLDNTLYFFTSGRFEPKNKGFDLCLEVMARLNAELRAEKLGKNVVFFIITSRATRSLNPLALEKRGVLNELREVCNHITEAVSDRLFWRAAAGSKLKLDDLIEEYWTLRYKRVQHALRQPCLPMVVTHIMQDDATDPVLNYLRQLNLINREEDPVKIVYHPEFINPTNPLWGIEYDQFVRGCHMGIFPSAYEPWGYTPLECLAMGVPAVTSDLAGIGRYVHENYPDHDSWGMKVLPRRGRSYQDAAADLTRYLMAYCRLDRRERIALRNEVDRHSWEFDWSKLGRVYHAAHDLAAERFLAGSSGDPLAPLTELRSFTIESSDEEPGPADDKGTAGSVSGAQPS